MRYSPPVIKVVFCWTSISGYMSACWKALAQEPGVEVHVLCYSGSKQTEFDMELMHGLNYTSLAEDERRAFERVHALVQNIDPDVVVLSGWLNRGYRSLALSQALRSKAFILAMDTPWRGDLRQRLAPVLLARYVRNFQLIVVPGERSWQYARKLGFAEKLIRQGLYGIDFEALAIARAERQGTSWPKAFLFVGRYEPEKGVELLVEGYRIYRRKVEDPWPLITCGKGPLETLLKTQKGILEQGFRQPAEIRRLMAGSAAFVLPSTYDPWPLVLVEACAAGLPIIATHACGSKVECLRHNYNGFAVAAGDADELAEALVTAHCSYERLPEMGNRSLDFARPYAAEEWARRWRWILSDALRLSPRSEPLPQDG